MSRTVEDYTAQLAALLPRGALWESLRADPLFAGLLGALAAELARVDARCEDLLDETDPRTVYELLAEWEAFAGLPSPCVTASQTLQERRAALHQQLTVQGGQSPAYFIAVAALLGYTITITEFRPFRAGRSAAGDALTNGPWVHTWRVTAPPTTIWAFRAGRSAAGEPLRTWGNERLECVVRRYQPAHTHVQFGYGGN